MNRKFFIILSAVFLAALAGAGFLIYKYQLKIAAETLAVFSVKENLQMDISASALSFLKENSVSTQDEIAYLKKEIEELKNRSPEIIYKTELTPADSLPAPDLKMQGELSGAKQKIDSLEKELARIQTQSSGAPASEGDANLIRSWQASEKVVQIACQDKMNGNWQMGSGVVISEDGKILTNQHVAVLPFGQIPDYCLALFNKDYDPDNQVYKREYRTTVSGFFEGIDAVLLKAQDVVYKDSGGQIQYAPLINSFHFFRLAESRPQIGDSVYIAGFPESAKFDFSVTKGIISNLNSGDIYFGTDAQIDRGNSGGAAIDASGRLIGLPTYKYAGSGDYRGYILDIHSLNLN